MLKNLLFTITFIFFQNISFGQCFIADYTHTYCPDEFVLNLTLAQTNGNGDYAYFENGIEILDPYGYFPTGTTLIDGVFTENLTGCVAEFQVIIEEVIFPEPNLQEEYFLDCLVSEISIDLNLSDDFLIDYYWTDPDGNLFSVEQTAILNQAGTYTLEMYHLFQFCSVFTEFEVILNAEFPTVTAEVVINCDTTATIGLTPWFDLPNYLIYWTGPGFIDVSDFNNVIVDSLGIYQYEIVDTNTGCIYTNTVEVTSLECIDTGLDDLYFGDVIDVFPNPTSGEVYLNIPSVEQKEYDIKIFNSIGNLVNISNALENSQEKIAIDLSQYPQGTYYIQLSTDDQSCVGKIEKL